jgi:hypothetical protein
MLPVIIGGLAIAFALSQISCGGEGELPPRSNLDDDEDAGKDAANEADAPDAKDAGKDADASEASVDAEAGIDAPIDVVDADASDDASDDAADAPDDASGDAYVDAEASVPAHYSCKFIATNKNGARFAMWMGSDVDIATSASGFDAMMHFSAAAGTPSELVDARVSAKASTWPKDGQDLDQLFNDVTGRYELTVSPSGADYAVAIRNALASATQYVNLTLLPMTDADINGNPLPIEPDTANEIYMGFSPNLVMKVMCTSANCASLEGSKDISSPTSDYNDISISCSQ